MSAPCLVPDSAMALVLKPAIRRTMGSEGDGSALD
jgi:hypothetical protein